MVQVSLIGYAVAGTFLNLATFDLYFHLVAIVAITDLLVQRVLARKGAPAAAKKDVITTMSPMAAKPRFNI